MNQPNRVLGRGEEPRSAGVDCAGGPSRGLSAPGKTAAPHLLPLTEAARILNLHPTTLREQCRNGKWSAIVRRVGSRWKFCSVGLDRYLGNA